MTHQCMHVHAQIQLEFLSPSTFIIIISSPSLTFSCDVMNSLASDWLFDEQSVTDRHWFRHPISFWINDWPRHPSWDLVPVRLRPWGPVLVLPWLQKLVTDHRWACVDSSVTSVGGSHWDVWEHNTNKSWTRTGPVPQWGHQVHIRLVVGLDHQFHIRPAVSRCLTDAFFILKVHLIFSHWSEGSISQNRTGF